MVAAAPESPVLGAQRPNTLGLAGFLVSLAAVFTCGCISPLALVLSFAALFQAPRGFAIAGTTLGAIGSWWLWGFGVVWLGSFFGQAEPVPIVQTPVAVVRSAAKPVEVKPQPQPVVTKPTPTPVSPPKVTTPVAPPARPEPRPAVELPSVAPVVAAKEPAALHTFRDVSLTHL